MKTLRECIKEAEETGVAIGHFNISNLEGLHGVYNSAMKLNVPVIIGLSEKEEDFVGREEAITLVKTFRERDNFPIFLNADHHYSFERVKSAIDSGFDSVIFDGVEKSLEENIFQTKKCVTYAKEISRQTGRDILVEAELGYIGSGSNLKDKIPEGTEQKTSPEEAEKFVNETGIDLLAPSVGNIHGIVKSGNPHIDENLLKEIKMKTKIPLVLHGGSGLSDEDFLKAISAGVSIIHISTELRVAYSDALKQSLNEKPNEIAPYNILAGAVTAIEEVATAKLKLFNRI